MVNESEMLEEQRRATPVRAEVDVLVVGAGSAGIAAAVAAAEAGRSTMLVDASGMVGGTLVAQLLEGSAGYHDAAGNLIVGGFAGRLIEMLLDYGSSPGHTVDQTGYSVTRLPYNHAELGLCEAVLLGKAGVRVQLNTMVVDVVVDRSGPLPVIRHVVLEGKGGRHAVRPAVVIDASGDADVAYKAGAAFQTDTADARQPSSVLFKVGSLDFEELLRYFRAHPEDFREGSSISEPLEEVLHLWGFGALLAQARRDGRLALNRDELQLAGWHRRGEAIVNLSRVQGDALDSGWSGRAAIEVSLQVLEIARFFREYVPGGANSYVQQVASRLGVRESRRVLGEYTMSADDVRAGAQFDDAVGLGGFPIDIHDPNGTSLSFAEPLVSAYQIPYRSLIVGGLDNLLVAGRCMSATHEAAGSLRLTPQCFVTGEAAGTAAALSVIEGTSPREIDRANLTERLRARNVILHV